MEKPHSGHTCQVVTFGNQKGGVHKSTTCVHTAAALGEMGRRVLIIDLDPNRGSTRHFGIKAETYLGVYEVILQGEDIGEVILTNDDDPDIQFPAGVHLIPGSRSLDALEAGISSMPHSSAQRRSRFKDHNDALLPHLDLLRGAYDYIFLDTGPNGQLPTRCGYRSCDWFIATTTPDRFGIEGLEDCLQDLKDAREAGASLKLLGVVVSGVLPRGRTQARLRKWVEETFAAESISGVPLRFEHEISFSVVVGDAQDSGTTIFQRDPNHKVTEQYRRLGREVDERIRTHLARQAEQGAPERVVEMTPAQAPHRSGGAPEAAKVAGNG